MKKMNKQVSLLTTKNYKNNLIEGKSTELLFSKLDSVLDDDGQIELKKSSYKILKQCVPAEVKNSKNYENNTGLIIGYVQSGKTMSFTSVIALAQDNNYRIVIVIAGRQKILLNQTTKRLKEDFKNNKNISIKEASPKSNALEIRRINKQLKKQSSKTTVITVLKDHRWINSLYKIFSDSIIKDELQKNSILIIDDEADSASLNSNAKSNKKHGVDNFSATFAAIVRLKNVFFKHSYLQYTATPQGPLLINYLNVLSPDWAVVLNPGRKYVGGKIYFGDNSKYIKHIPYEGVGEKYPPDIGALLGPPRSLDKSIREFFVISSIMCYPNNNDKIINENSSMMIHPTYIVNSDKGIKTWYDWTKNIVDDIELELEYENYENFKIIYKELKESISLDKNLFPNFSEIIDRIDTIINDELKIWYIVGGQNNTNMENGTIAWDDYQHHILVGGQLLDRGFTVKDLVSTYMPRDTKGKNQADTIEQRCRFFGYKEHYLDFCRVYLPRNMISDYKSYVEHEENIHNFLKDKPLSEFKKTGSRMLLDSNLIATNMSRIDEQILNSTLSGFQYFEPTFPKENTNNNLIESFLKNIDNDDKIILEPNLDKDKRVSRKHYVNQINSNDILDLIKYFDVTSAKETIKKAHIIQYLESVTSDDKVWLIQIGPENTEKRKRTIKINIDNTKSGNNIYNISQLSFGGIKSDIKEKGRYFGDRDLIMNDSNENIHYNDELIVQIHQIQILKKDTIEEIDIAIKKLKNPTKLKDNSIDEFDVKFIISDLENLKSDLNDKVFYTLALNFPSSYKKRYIQKI